MADLERQLEEARKRIDSLTNQLEDVVNELDLSDAAIEKHGQIGTAPADLVKLVLEEAQTNCNQKATSGDKEESQ